MKIMIEIEEDYYKIIQHDVEHGMDYNPYVLIANGTPLPEKQHCEDCISREAVIRLVEQYPNIIGNRCSGLIADIKHLPSVTPLIPDVENNFDIGYNCGYADAMIDISEGSDTE